MNLARINSSTLIKALYNNNCVRNLSFSKILNSNSFNVQDADDFKKRVLDNSKPVIVDFHAGLNFLKEYVH